MFYIIIRRFINAQNQKLSESGFGNNQEEKFDEILYQMLSRSNHEAMAKNSKMKKILMCKAGFMGVS